MDRLHKGRQRHGLGHERIGEFVARGHARLPSELAHKDELHQVANECGCGLQIARFSAFRRDKRANPASAVMKEVNVESA